jgi:hypothetical protein
VIDPEIFEQLVTRITAETPPSDAELLELADDPAIYACACELDVIWRLTGALKSPSSAAASE